MIEAVEEMVHFDFPELVSLLDSLASHVREDENLITEGGYFVYPDTETDDSYANTYHKVQSLVDEVVDTAIEEISQFTIKQLEAYGYRVDMASKIISSKAGMFSFF